MKALILALLCLLPACGAEAVYTATRMRPMGQMEFQALQSASSTCADGTQSENCRTANVIQMQQTFNDVAARGGGTVHVGALTVVIPDGVPQVIRQQQAGSGTAAAAAAAITVTTIKTEGGQPPCAGTHARMPDGRLEVAECGSTVRVTKQGTDEAGNSMTIQGCDKCPRMHTLPDGRDAQGRPISPFGGGPRAKAAGDLWRAIGQDGRR